MSRERHTVTRNAAAESRASTSLEALRLSDQATGISFNLTNDVVAEPRLPTADISTTRNVSYLPARTPTKGVIAVTGFGHFNGVEHNPTEELIKRLVQPRGEEASLSSGFKLFANRLLAAGPWTGAAKAALPEIVPGLRSDPSLEPGWGLGLRRVLKVAGAGALPDLLKTLDDPLDTALMQNTKQAVQVSTLSTAQGQLTSVEGSLASTLTFPVNKVSSVANTRFMLENTPVLPDGQQRVIWLHLGVYSGSKEFRIESQAYNDASFLCADEMGWQPWKERICAEDGPTSHVRQTDLPVDWLVMELKKKGFAVGPSSDAGRFVCNYVYYHSLRHCQQLSQQYKALTEDPTSKNSCSSLFVHVPDFSTISEDEQLRFLSCLLELLSHC